VCRQEATLVRLRRLHPSVWSSRSALPHSSAAWALSSGKEGRSPPVRCSDPSFNRR